MENTNTTLLKVNNLKKHFAIKAGVLSHIIAKVYAVDGLSFDIKVGETLGLVGESGCGKTTVGRLIVRLIEPTSGSIKYKNKDLLLLSHREMKKYRQKMTMMFQDPYSSLDPRMTVGKIISEPLRIHNVCNSKQEINERVVNVLREVGFRADITNRYPHEFSGGQRQRIGLARAIIVNPELIIADEPVSALDVSIQAQVLNLLVSLQKKYNFTFLFISHDLRVIQYISDRVAVMYLGRLVELADVEKIYNRPMHPYTKALLSSAPILNPELKRKDIILEGDVPSPINPPPGCPFHLRCKYKIDICSKEEPNFIELEKKHYVACHNFLLK